MYNSIIILFNSSYNVNAKVDAIQHGHVRNLLTRLLSHEADDRRGSRANADIRSHPFFDTTDWHQIHSLSMDAPIITTTRDCELTKRTFFEFGDLTRI